MFIYVRSIAMELFVINKTKCYLFTAKKYHRWPNQGHAAYTYS